MENPFATIENRLGNIENILHEQIKAPKEVILSEPKDELLTIQEAAKFLNLSKFTIYSKVHKREIPFSKMNNGKRLYFSKMELMDYIKGGKVKTNYELEQDAHKHLTSKDKK